MANILSSRFSKCLILTIAHLVLASCMSERSAPETVERLCDRSFDIDNSNVHYLTEELETCTRINGAIFIRYTSQLQDLSFLSNVKRVDGGMIISDNSGLTNIDGLQNIEHIEWLELERNPKVRQLRLGKTIVQGDVRIEENKELELISLDSLNAKFIYIIGNLKLERIDVATSIYASGIVVYANNQLTQVQGLSGDSSWASGLNFGDNNILQEVAFNSPIRNAIGSITFLDNPLLDTFTNFHTLETIGESFQIKGSGIQDLSGFSSLTEVAGDLRIENNPLMKTLAGLEGLQAVKGELRISDHPALTKIEDFSLLTTVGSITVANNSALEDSFSVPLLEDVGRFLVVSGNAALTSLPNFDSLKAIEKGLYIYGNPQLKNLIGLGGLRAVNGVVILKNNLSTINDLAQLESVNGNMFIEEPSLEDPILLNNLVNIQKVVIGAPTPILKVAESNGKSSQEAPSVYMYATDIDNFKSRICTNETYESPEDLSGCYYVAGSILLKDIPGLESLEFFDSLMHVEGDLEINSNPDLRALNIEYKLNYMGGNLIVKDNPSLESILGFDGLTSVGEGIYINDNPSLGLVNGFNQLNSVGSGFYNFEQLSYQEDTFNSGVSFARNAPDFEVVGFNAISWLYSLSLYGESIELNGFSSLSSVGGLTIGDVNAISIPEALVKVDDNMLIANASLPDLSAFNGIEEIGQNLQIEGRFESIQGFNSLLSIGGAFDIRTYLYTLDLTEGFNRLLYCGQPNIQKEPAITSLPDDDYEYYFETGVESFLIKIAGKEYVNEVGTFCGRP